MNYKIAICDDSVTDRKYITDLVNRWADQTGHSLQTFDFSSAENFMFHYADEKDYDILLLDIEMGGMNGVELAKRIRQDNDTVQMIFITGFPDFIAEGYEVSALHYLMKPVSEEKLFAVMDRAAKNSVKTEKCLLVTLDQTLKRIPMSSIMYAETFAHYVVLATEEGEYVTY
jgi:DNA-binding LytR/AlgR family response regulator